MDFDRLFYSTNSHVVDMHWSQLGVSMQAALTVLIGIAAVYIAYQQHVTNKRQLRLALFQRRLAVYESMMKLRGLVLAHGRLDLNHMFDYIRETREHQFLFGEDVADYISETYHNAVKVWNTGQQSAFLEPVTAARATEWFVQQEKVAREKFLKYMDFTEP